MTNIKVIDLFSGPGGLGEGFTSLLNHDNQPYFKIATSIEKEPSAHRTLTLRAFFRQFSSHVPQEYYEFLQGKLGKKPEERLYPLFPKQHEAAKREALCLELGKDNDTITQTISDALDGDDCILIGGPPCQAYSTAGVARNKGNKDYDPAQDHRNFLYKEYLAVIAKFQPKLFVMENVKGMLSAKVNGKHIYKEIFSDLKSPTSSSGFAPLSGKKSHEYKIFSLAVDNTGELQPKDYVIKSELFGIPQNRHRVILLGVRSDVELPESITLQRAENMVSVQEVLSDLPRLRSGLSKDENTSKNWVKAIKTESRVALRELNVSHKEVVGTMKDTIQHLDDSLSQGATFGLKRNTETPNTLSDWYFDPKLGDAICNHETRGHINSDLARYLFCSCWGKTYGENNAFASPKSHDFPRSLVPAHKSFNTGKFADRFRVQLGNRPATTITSHISKDGHYFIHPDPTQCRSLTVREAARIQTFPDNYFFVGTRTQQYVQVGNAVPPLLARQIAALVRDILFR